jgi:hypothetical protein
MSGDVKADAIRVPRLYAVGAQSARRQPTVNVVVEHLKAPAVADGEVLG